MRDSELFKSLQSKQITPQSVKAAVFDQVALRNPIPATDLGMLVTEAAMDPVDTAVLATTIENGLDSLSCLPQYTPIRKSYQASLQYLASLPQATDVDRDYIKLMNVYDGLEHQF